MAVTSRFVVLASVVALAGLAACSSEPPTSPQVNRTLTASQTNSQLASSTLPSGERHFGQVSVEPAYNSVTGTLIFLLTPDNAPNPSHANAAHATAPLYLVEYPPGSTVGTMNCMGVPGNCPDHDGAVAGLATNVMPGVYGTNPAAVPGHDHLVAPPASGGDFNIAWEVVEILFTNKAAANTRLTTEAAIDAAIARGDAIEIDLGFAFNCSVVPSTTYYKGTPVG